MAGQSGEVDRCGRSQDEEEYRHRGRPTYVQEAEHRSEEVSLENPASPEPENPHIGEAVREDLDEADDGGQTG